MPIPPKFAYPDEKAWAEGREHVVSANDCTGLVPGELTDEAQAESLNEIIDGAAPRAPYNPPYARGDNKIVNP